MGVRGGGGISGYGKGENKWLWGKGERLADLVD